MQLAKGFLDLAQRVSAALIHSELPITTVGFKLILKPTHTDEWKQAQNDCLVLELGKALG